MNYKKCFKIIALIVFVILLIVSLRMIIFVHSMNSSMIVVESNEGIIEKGYSLKYWDIKRQEKDKQIFIHVSIAHSKRWLYTTTPYSGISHLFLVFRDNKLEYAESIFNDNFFIFEGSAELVGNNIKNIILTSTNEGINHRSIEYLIKNIDIDNAKITNVENYFSSLVDNLDKYKEIIVR